MKKHMRQGDQLKIITNNQGERNEGWDCGMSVNCLNAFRSIPLSSPNDKGANYCSLFPRLHIGCQLASCWYGQ